MANDFWILLAMVIYFAAMLSIGFIYSKRSNSSSKEYFAGGRGVGPWLTALSAEASDMSGWLLMGLPGLAYFTGAADPDADRRRTGARHLSQLEACGPATAPLLGSDRRCHHHS